MAQVIGEEPLPTWLEPRPGLLTQTRQQMVGPVDGLRMLHGTGVKVVREAAISCGCFVNNADARHFDAGVLLNPSIETIGDQRVAVLYENLMYVGAVTNSWTTGLALPRVQVGRAESMWWAVSTLESGWYDNGGRRVDYEFNPPYMAEGVEVMPTQVSSGARVLGQTLRYEGGSQARVIAGPPLRNDDGASIERWVMTSYIRPALGHRTALPPATPATWTDATADLTYQQKITRLNERFEALTRATISLAKDEDWCGDYEEASSRMGLAEDDYDRTPESVPTSFEVSITLRYELGASQLDTIISDQFGGSHDIQMSLDVESPVRVTVTQGSEDFDQDEHEWDEILDSAGYSDYEDIDITSWRTI